jgi:hypothetical protein
MVIIDDGAHRNSDGEIFSGTAGTIASPAGSPVFSLIMVLVAEVEQGRQSMRGSHDDVATVPSIPAVRASAWNKHLPSEAADAVSATTGSYRNVYFIDKHDPSMFHRRLGSYDEKVYPTLTRGGREN